MSDEVTEYQVDRRSSNGISSRILDETVRNDSSSKSTMLFVAIQSYLHSSCSTRLPVLLL